MFEAARVTDPIEHTSALTGFLIGAAIGIALIAAVAFATFTCGFGVALLAGLAAGIGASAILGLGEAIGKMFTSTSGAVNTGSPNVFINSKKAAYATVSTVTCSKHSPTPLVAQGSAGVFINSKPAARKKDKITCGAAISDGSPNPYRYRVRPPSFINLTVLEDMCLGQHVADVVIILGSVDIVLGEVDR